ncbi:hypothetical protein WN55_03042 [Dufourea novaeangliae]|uniref:Uncharacterized protein n=1 Tax=Dufourea novaeangliae TaxID=178035 RepID=A0A154PI26_DUFNO|nr:hypothetical protein WN55_03042 [Dufourea novaeangliae]
MQFRNGVRRSSSTSGEGVKFTGCTSDESHSGVADKSDRIFIDAKLAISSPVTIPELCISLGDSRFEVYPSRSFPSAASNRSTHFHHPRAATLRHHPPFRSSSSGYVVLDRLSPSLSFSRSFAPSFVPSRRCSCSLPSDPFSNGNVTYWSNEREEKERIPTNPTNHSGTYPVIMLAISARSVQTPAKSRSRSRV